MMERFSGHAPTQERLDHMNLRSAPRRLTTPWVLAVLSLALLPLRVQGVSHDGEWQFFAEEAHIGGELLALAQAHRPAEIAFRNARLLDLETGALRTGTTVVVSGGRIVAVGADAATPVPKTARVVDAQGRVLIPGLVDMHVHDLVSWSQLLLNLTQGVTTVRDMNGFPWLLALRDRVRSSEILGPNLYVTGQVLNFEPFDWYFRVVKTPQEARAAVDEQARAGYDFIKIHNSMPFGLYRAIAEEAHKVGLDFVGHIPHDILVADAVRLGQRTLEHMKGFYLDSGLTPSTEDWLSAMRRASGVYVCPTFVSNRSSFRGEEAHRFLAAPEMRYASWRVRLAWQGLASQPASANLKLEQNLLPMSLEMSRQLRQIGTPFLAGTDSGGGFAFLVPGFALHDELRYFLQAGFSPLETLRTATLNAARAMRKEAEFGAVAPGQRADLVLLAADPAADFAALEKIEGVMVRGIWLDRATLDGILAGLAHLYAQPEKPPPPLDAGARRALVAQYRNLRAQGLPLRDHDLATLYRLLDEAGDAASSDEVSSWRAATRRP
jgi:imidazolonepropionase-like amidohydrolase